MLANIVRCNAGRCFRLKDTRNSVSVRCGRTIILAAACAFLVCTLWHISCVNKSQGAAAEALHRPAQRRTGNMAAPVKTLLAPAFTDLQKSSRDILYGSKAGEGVFNTSFKASADTVTADGVILSTSVLQAPGSSPTTSLSAIWSPAGRKNLTLNGFVTGTGAISLGATTTSFLGVPGLQASLLASPPNVLSTGQLTLDYLYGVRGHARAIITPNPKSLTSPTVDMSATYRLTEHWTAGVATGVDLATKAATNWSAGAVWLNPRGVEVGAVLSDSQPSAGGHCLFAPGRSANAHLVAPVSDNTYVALEYMQPLTNQGGAAAAAPGFSLGLSHKAPSGALVKGKLEHSGLLALLYEQKVEGLGRLALTAATDATAVTSTTPKVGLTLYYA